MMATTVNDDSLKGGLALSAALHVLLFLFLYFGLPVLFTPLPEHHVPVPFEIVEIADITNTRLKDQEPKPEPKPEPPPPKPEVKPQPAQVQALPQPKPPEPQVEALKPALKPKPPEPAKPKTDEFAKLLKNLEANKKPDTPKTESKADSKEQTTAHANSQAPALSDRLTISQEDALRRQIEQCWNIPIGARDAQSLIVQLSIDVNPDRTVQHAEVVDKSRMATDSFYRAAAEAALRAIYNPRCSPLELPADKYDQWKHIDFTFDPRDML
jgi:outer membrane biosynthesis protein TonB